MDATLEALSRLGRFARTMTPNPRNIELALPAARALFTETGAPFLIVGGVAVVHHGYLRTTEDIDVLVDPASLPTLLRHVASDVPIDLLIAGEPMPRPGSPRYPFPDATRASPNDAAIVDLGLLCELKLHAHRHRDLADVVELLQRLTEGRYQEVEAAVPPIMRPELAALRRDALEEQSFHR
jgi:hypothetical protein